MNMGKRIREARKKKGLTQQQLADAIGVAKSTVTGYEKGNSNPSLDLVAKMIAVLSVDANYFFQDEGDFQAKVSYEELQFLEDLRSLPQKDRDVVYSIVKNFKDKMNPDTPDILKNA